MNEVFLNDLLNNVRLYNEQGIPLIEKAYHYAKSLHDGQFRQSGESYISHPLNVAYILSEMHATHLCSHSHPKQYSIFDIHVEYT